MPIDKASIALKPTMAALIDWINRRRSPFTTLEAADGIGVYPQKVRYWLCGHTADLGLKRTGNLWVKMDTEAGR